MLVNIGGHVPTGCYENCRAYLLGTGNQNKVEIARLISEIASILYNPRNAKSIRESVPIVPDKFLILVTIPYASPENRRS